MQNKKKNKKLTEGEGFTLAQEQPLGLSIGALLGVPQKECAAEHEEKKAEPQSARGAKAEAAAQPKISAPARGTRRQNRHARDTSAGLQGRHSCASEGAAQGPRLRLDDRGRKNRPPRRHIRPRRGVVCQKRRGEDHEKRLKRVIYI